MKSALIVLLALIAFQTSAFAGVCTVTVDRVPVDSSPETVKKAHDKYKTAQNPTGNPTVEEKEVANEKACIDGAKKKNCSIVRKDILKHKKVSVKYDGKDVQGGADLCL